MPTGAGADVEPKELTSASVISRPTSSIGTTSTSGKRSRHTIADLPLALQEDRKWSKYILPALLTWAGSLDDPWMIADQDLMNNLRAIVTAVIPHFKDLTDIRPGAPAFILVLASFYLIGLWLIILNRRVSGLVSGAITLAPLPLLLSLIFLAWNTIDQSRTK